MIFRINGWFRTSGRQFGDHAELANIDHVIALIDGWKAEQEQVKRLQQQHPAAQPSVMAESAALSSRAMAPLGAPLGASLGGSVLQFHPPGGVVPPLETLADALRHISPDLPYQEWLHVLMAIHSAYPDASGLALADQWSAGGAKYVPGEVLAKWRGFKPDGGRSVGTLIHLAQRSGWGPSMGSAPMRAQMLQSAAQTLWGGQGGAYGLQTPQQPFAGLRPPQVETAEPEDIKDLFGSWEETDESDIPKRDWLYGFHYIRKFASLTVAPGGLGKSSLVLAEAIAMASGRPILDVFCKRRKVLYFNAEDPMDEIKRRVLGVCKLHGVPQSELVGQLFVASGRDTPMILAEGETCVINAVWFERLYRYADEVGIDVFIADPLANMTFSPETNEVFRRLASELSTLADRANISVEIVHHTRKLNGNEATAEDSRGGSALIGAVRSARVLNPMTKDEAQEAGLETHVHHFRVDDGKANLAPRSENASWYIRQGVALDNGDSVGVVEPWEWPDAFDGISREEAYAVQRALRAYPDGLAFFPNAKDWVGFLIADTLGLDPEEGADKARVKKILRTWIDNEVLSKTEGPNPAKKSRTRPVVVCGSNDMGSMN